MRLPWALASPSPAAAGGSFLPLMLSLGVISSKHLFETELGVTAFPRTSRDPTSRTPAVLSPVCTVRAVPPVPRASPWVPRAGGGGRSASSHSVCVDVLVCGGDGALARGRRSALPGGVRRVTVCHRVSPCAPLSFEGGQRAGLLTAPSEPAAPRPHVRGRVGRCPAVHPGPHVGAAAAVPRGALPPQQRAVSSCRRPATCADGGPRARALGEGFSRSCGPATRTLGPRPAATSHAQRRANTAPGASCRPATGRWEVPGALQDGTRQCDSSAPCT